jgi:L-aspartate oxidase
VFGARASRAAAAERKLNREIPIPDWRFEPPGTETRERMWRFAGPRRDAEGLEALLDDPYPLAALIGRATLERRESRGAHRRADFPQRDSELDGVHLVIDARGRASPQALS